MASEANEKDLYKRKGTVKSGDKKGEKMDFTIKNIKK